MKNLLLMVLVGIIGLYSYVIINESQKEKALLRRVPQLKNVNKYEFTRALYQIKQVRLLGPSELKTKEQVLENEPTNELSTEQQLTRPENIRLLERLKKEYANPAEPIDLFQQNEGEEEEPVVRRPNTRLPNRFNNAQTDVENETTEQTEPTAEQASEPQAQQ